MILRPAEVPSRILWRNPARFTLLRFESDFIQQLIDKTDGLNQGELTVRCRFSDPVIQTLVQALIADLQAGCPAGPLYGETFGMSIAVHLLQQSLTSSPALPEYPDGLSEQARTQVLDFIEANLDQDIRLEDLAQVSGLSKYYFSRLFKQTMEIPPHQYIIRRRIERAKGLLKQTKMSIADVSLASGFGHQSHLSYHFKRIVGISPKAFRKQ
jgi:AraC family transcriptional regulator